MQAITRKVATMNMVKIGGMFVNMAQVTHVEVVEANKYNVRHVRFYLNHILDGIQNYVVFDDANDIEAALRYLDNISFDADDADDVE